MAGHSKWANTKYRKASQDIKKSKIFTKIIKELIIASKLGGKNPDTNPNLRAIIEKALNHNMSRNTINKTISQNAPSFNNSSDFTRIQYGALGKKGVALILDCLSNNKNRTVSEIRYIFSKFNFNLAPITSVEYFFKKIGVMFYSKKLNISQIKNISIKYNAEYVLNNNSKYITVTSDVNKLAKIKSKLIAINIKPIRTELSIIPYIFVELEKEDNINFNIFIKKLKKNTDIQKIHHNVKIINIL